MSILFQLYHGKSKLNFDNMIMMLALHYKTNTYSWIFIVLTNCKNSLRVEMSLR